MGQGISSVSPGRSKGTSMGRKSLGGMSSQIDGSLLPPVRSIGESQSKL